MVVLSSLHPRYHKAARNYDVELRVSEVSPQGAISMLEVESLIDSNTVAVVVSAPAVATGRFEPVRRFASLGKKHQVGVHVDSSLGFFYPFLSEKYPGCEADFSIPGVTTISVGL